MKLKLTSFAFPALLAAFAVLTCSAAQAVTFTVDRTDDASVSACSGAANDCTLRGAITVANASASADIIEFAPGVTGTITLGGAALPGLTGGIVVEGPGANVLTVSGGNAIGILRVLAGATARVSGLTLTAGNATSTGAGGQATGGAIDVANGATLLATRLWVKDNQALGGGGIESFGTLTVRDSTFSGNSATAGTGGAIHSTPNSLALTISNSTFISNRAASSGGAIRSDIANTTLDHLTVASNRADSDGNNTGTGGGISAGGASFAVRNGIITSNSPNDVDNVITAGNFNYVGGTAANAGLEIQGSSLALKDNGGPTPTVAINVAGAAFNGGNPSFDATNLPFDQRGNGFPRVKAGRLDIGAFELQTEAPSLVVTTLADTVADDDQTSLREAINFANTNFDASGITFAPSVTGTIALQSSLPVIQFATTLRGPGADRLTIARAGNTTAFGLLTLDSDRPPFTSPPFAATISGLTFTGGSATQGGAIYARKANLTINDCAFNGNTAFNGGAVAGAAQSTFVVRNSTFSGNVATHNGGAFYTLNLATLEQCTIDGNQATDFGGGVFGSAKITFDSCTITGNRAQSTGNGNGGNGGGINVLNGPPLLRNSIIAGNSRGAGGAIADDIAGAVDSASAFNLIGDGTGSSGLTNGANGNQIGSAAAPIDPLLEALADNGGPTATRALLAGSPAINKGDPAFDATGKTDARGTGFPRKVGGTIDIGAFESNFPNNPPLLNNATFSTSINIPFSQQLAGSDPDGDTLTYARASGTLPTGLTLSSSGLISGTPIVAGRFDFSVNVNDGKDTLNARFIIIVSTNSDGIGPVITRNALPNPTTREQLAAFTLAGTVTDVAPTGVTPSGVKRMIVQLRRDADNTSYSGPTDGFTTNLDRGFYPVTLSAATADTSAARNFTRSLSWVPSASALTPGGYSLVVLAQDNAGNFSVEVVRFNVIAGAPVSRMAPPKSSGSSAFSASSAASGGAS